jgi:hypothetical protein
MSRGGSFMFLVLNPFLTLISSDGDPLKGLSERDLEAALDGAAFCFGHQST